MPPEHTEVREGAPSKKRILFVTYTNGYGGTELHLIRLIESFDPASIQPTVVCFGEDPYTPLLKSNSRVQIHVYRTSPPSGFRGYWALMRRFHPDAVLFVSGWHGLFPLAGYLAARLSMARRVCTIEQSTPDPRIPWPKSWIDPRSLLRWVAGWHARTTITNALIALISNQTICVSDRGRMRFVRDYAYPLRKTSTIWNGVDVSRYCFPPEMRLAARKALGIGSEEKVLVYVGRLHWDKGPDVLFEALCRLRRSGPPCRCLVVGDGPLRDDVGRFVTENELSSMVTFFGFQEDVRSYLAASDIFVLPSRTEGLPFALLEAMSSGLACIATDVGGVREVIPDSVYGLVVIPESADGLAEAIRRLLSDAGLRSTIGMHARERIQAEFDERRTLAEVRGLLLN